MVFFGDSGLQTILIELVRQMPESDNRRRALLRLLWHDAAGAIISRHVLIRRCHTDGRLSVQVNDPRWMQPIRDASRLIIERINRALEDLGFPEYAIHRLDIYRAPQVPPQPSRRHRPPESVRLPPDLSEKVDRLPESLRKSFIAWYQSAMAASDGPDSPPESPEN